MALYDYEFSISDDFTSLPTVNDLNITILQQQIDTENSITPPVHHILANIDDDNCLIYFETELTSEEEDVLAGIIANHTGLFEDGTDPDDVQEEDGGPADINFVFADSANDYHLKFSSSSFRIGCQFIFSGKNQGMPSGVKVIAEGDGCIRLYDKTNNNIIFEWHNKDFGNDFNIWSKAPLDSNLLPSNEAIFELQAKKDGSDNVYISCFQLTYSPSITDNEPPDQSGSCCCSEGGSDDGGDDDD
jgi:hypothetical protein